MDLYSRTVREDVRELGALLGDVFRAQSSPAAFETVEDVRTAAIAAREGDEEARDRLRGLVDGLDPERASVVSRAFTTYFELVNLAEERERVRAIREGEQAGGLEDSLAAAVETLAADGADADDVAGILDDVLVQPTFTAHPTEARRKTVKAKLRTVADHLETLDERRLTDRERERTWDALEAEVAGLWKTPQVRSRRPEPLDEARNVQWYLENTVFDVLPDLYDELRRALEETFESPPAVPTLYEFRSWAGSDRDGNPFVTPEVTTETLERQRAVALRRHRDSVVRLAGVLSQDATRTEVTDEFEASLDADRERLPAVAAEAAERYPNEPYRQQLRLMAERLDRVADVRPGGYADADELLSDLRTLAASLRAGGDAVVAETQVEPVARQVETFGFTLASLDLRDHRENHTEAVAAALGREGIDYRDLSEAERTELLTEAIQQAEPVIDVGDADGLSDTAARVLTRFDRLGDWQAEFGVDAIDTYCISMTDEPSHVLEVLFLADQAGVVALPEHSGLDVVPLLETEYALSGAERIMGTLFENPAYEAALAARGGVQEVMIGYSDSNKENGFLAANWDLDRNQRRLARIADDHGVTLRLFHGRGGSISRGGGPMNEALLALPTETVTGEVKFTQQGEAISETYANPHVAGRNLEQMLNAQLRARHRAVSGSGDRVREAWTDAMAEMAEAARTAYRDLLASEGFVDYFGQATPISVIEDLNLGSRPASRSGERTVEDLRAIPWVFSWTQSRCILPGWYAVGTGVEAYLDDGGDIDLLREMYEEWPFFRTTLDNAALALARTELEIAAEYADLADDDLRERFFPHLRAEYERSVDVIERISGRDDLLTRGWLEDSLRRRNPYVDPLNLLQTKLLSRTHRSEAEERTLRLTVKGIAAGMKNTG